MKPRQDRNPREEITIDAARRQFLNAKRGNVKDSTHRAYKYPTRHFADYCAENDVEYIGEVNSYLMESWVQKREAENIKAITAQQTVKHVRVFIKWCENSGLIEPGVYSRTRVPNVEEKEQVSHDVLRAHRAKQVLDFLSTYEYATTNHTLFRLMWDTGCRISGAMSLDLEDIGRDRQGDPTLEFVDRKQQGTPLKNSEKSERIIQISEGLNDLLEDYINRRRPDVTDEYGRNPLFTTGNGRIQRQRAYKNTVVFTRPCVYSGKCPVGKEIETCEFTKKERAMSCPESVSLHPIRRGSITDHINRGWDKEPLSERVDVSVSVLEKHYDARTKEDELQKRKQYKDLL